MDERNKAQKTPHCLRVRKLVLLCFLYIQWPEQETPADSNSEQELNFALGQPFILNWLSGQTGETSLISYLLNIRLWKYHLEVISHTVRNTIPIYSPHCPRPGAFCIRVANLSSGQSIHGATLTKTYFSSKKRSKFLQLKSMTGAPLKPELVCILRNINQGKKKKKQKHSGFKAWVIWWSINTTL